MKFLILDKGFCPDAQVRCVPKLREAMKVFGGWVKAAKMESWYHFADRVGGIGIVNVESLEELNEMLIEHPLAGITTTEVYPLVDPHISLARQIAWEERAEAS